MGLVGRIIGRLLGAAKVCAVAAFVLWHLSTMFYRNVADLWPEKVEAARATLPEGGRERELLDRFDALGSRYARLTATGQGWCMFASPLSREGAFPAVVLVWPDEAETLVLSDNEPADVTKFFRVGDCRQRKLEDHLVGWHADPAGEEADLFKNYVFWRFKVWQSRHPDDRREPKELRLVRRNYLFLDWNAGDTEYGDVAETVVAAYGSDGELRP